MKKPRKQNPRNSFRAFCIFAAVVSACFTLKAQSPGARGRGVAEVKTIDVEEGKRRINRLRNQQLSGDFVFYFELKHMPKHGKSVRYRGTLWGSWNTRGPVMRLYLNSEEPSGGDLIQLLVQSGPVPEAWLFERDGSKRQLRGEALFAPLISGMRYSAFDLMMPFVYWDKYIYEGSERVRGQAGHIFNMYPPEYSKSTIGRVRMSLHAGYNVLIQAEMFGPSDQLFQTLNILSFKKVKKEWIIKSADLLDEKSHDKTRFKVLEAEIGIPLDSDFFTPLWTKPHPVIEGLRWTGR